jgi:hypothetical protein
VTNRSKVVDIDNLLPGLQKQFQCRLVIHDTLV